jgi:hypothetical protein
MEAEEKQKHELAPAREQLPIAEDSGNSNDATKDSTNSKDEQSASKGDGDSSSSTAEKAAKEAAASVYANKVALMWKSFAKGARTLTNHPKPS